MEPTGIMARRTLIALLSVALAGSAAAVSLEKLTEDCVVEWEDASPYQYCSGVEVTGG